VDRDDAVVGTGCDEPVVLLGLMGSGKTTVGRLVAEALALPLLDSDEVLAERFGLSAAAMQARDGAEALHAAEAEILLEQLAAPEPTVIAAAASTVEDGRVVAALRDRALVGWLAASPEVLAGRAHASPHRPLPADPDETVRRLAAQLATRGPLFASAADLVLDVADHTPDELAAAIVAERRERCHDEP
jgi:shikimate kinase